MNEQTQGEGGTSVPEAKSSSKVRKPKYFAKLLQELTESKTKVQPIDKGKA